MNPAIEPTWQALERGCRAKRSTLRYSQAESQSLFDALCSWRHTRS